MKTFVVSKSSVIIAYTFGLFSFHWQHLNQQVSPANYVDLKTSAFYITY